MPEEPALSRRGVLVGLGGLGALAVVGGSPALATAAPERGPLDLRFRVTDQFRPFDLIAPGFEQFDTATARDRASTAARGGRVGDDGAVQLAGDTLMITSAGPRAPFCSVLVEVGSLAADSSVVAGMALDQANSVLVRYSSDGSATIEVTVGGRRTIVDSAKQAPLRAPFRLAFVLNENAVTVLVDATNTGTGWEPLVSEREGVSGLIDLRVPGRLRTMRYAFGGSGTATLGRVRAGYFGQAGLRDGHLVQTAEGRPLIRDNKIYFTFTCAGLGFFQQAHWGVWAMDIANPRRLEQVSQLFFQRDGVIVGDHAGQVVYDERRNRYIVAMSSWGDFAFNGVHVRHVETAANVLSGVHVLRTARFPLPTAVSAWDPSLTRIGDRWHVAFVESPRQSPVFEFHPALAVGPPGGTYHQDLRLRRADTSLDQTEGTIIQRVGDRWYLFASDGDAREYRVYDLETMNHLGSLDAPYRTNIPHPQLVEVPTPTGTRWWLVTFDGTQYAEGVLGYGGHGDVLVMRDG
ncbi:hypothetical protein [Allokutzneria albata]|uniref:Uncharacterized protein n=1 Tax=Allokutzneria albata TaxID=211114 RepID=A0A1G9QX41_ALLAB|nr:hypothetical protein [Allokutzneria albata]SDM15440.1 hypothetical protein SAMN04489726_0056 [Allokutzneria albata]